MSRIAYVLTCVNLLVLFVTSTKKGAYLVKTMCLYRFHKVGTLISQGRYLLVSSVMCCVSVCRKWG